MKKNLATGVFLAFIIGLGLCLRVIDLDGKYFYCDEIESYDRARQGFTEVISSLIGGSPHLPLYESMLHLWLLMGNSDAFARLPSVVFGIASILLTWQLFKTISSQRIALFVALLFAVSPLHVMFSRMVREYSLLCMLSIASTILFIKLLRKTEAHGKSRLWLSYFIVTLLLVYTHYYAWFTILSQTIYLFTTRARHKHLLKTWFFLQAMLVILLLPWVLGNLDYLLHGEDAPRTYYASMFGHWVKVLFTLFVLSLGLTVHPWNLKIVIPAVIGFSSAFILGMRSLLQWRTSHINGHLLILFLFLIPFSIEVFIPVCAPRQILGSLPFFYAIIGMGIFKINRTWIRTVVCALILLVCLFSLQNYFTDRQFVDADMVTPWDKIGQDIAGSAYDTDTIVLLTTYSGNFYHYYRGPAKVIYQLPHFASRKYPELYREEFVIRELQGYEDFKSIVGDSQRTWVLVAEGCGMSKSAEDWLIDENARVVGNYQLEEHTLRGLRESWASRHKYRSYLYRLYLCGRSSE